jgi:hypothetical protein
MNKPYIAWALLMREKHPMPVSFCDKMDRAIELLKERIAMPDDHRYHDKYCVCRKCDVQREIDSILKAANKQSDSRIKRLKKRLAAAYTKLQGKQK